MTTEEQRKKWREDKKKFREKNPNHSKEVYDKRKDLEIYKKSHRKANSKYYYNNKEKSRAKDLAQNHIEMKGLCERCKKVPAKHRHHPDYSKPLQVQLVCHKCHREIHKGTSKGCGKGCGVNRKGLVGVEVKCGELYQREIRLCDSCKPKNTGNPGKTGTSICVCGHEFTFHDVLDNNACHLMDCKCKKFKEARG